MKIIDKEKDCYDYLSTMYGVDNRLVYRRNSTIETDFDIGSLVHWVEVFKYLNYRAKEFLFGALVVVDKVFIIKINIDVGWYYEGFENRVKKSAITISNVEQVRSEVKKQQNDSYVPSMTIPRRNSPSVIEDPDMRIAKAVGQPVFAVVPCLHNESIVWIPKLWGAINNESFYSAEQIYQKIELFLGLQIDMMPEPKTPNDVKILQAGFDLKESFRNRK